MATELNKDVVREVELNGKVYLVSLTADKKITFREKGKKRNVFKTLEDLLSLLTTSPFITNSPAKGTINIQNSPDTKDSGDCSHMVSISDVRSKILTSTEFDLNTKIKLEKIITPMIQKSKNK